MFVAPLAELNMDQNHDSSNDSGNAVYEDAISELQHYSEHESTDVAPIFCKTYQLMEKISATHIGQYVFKRADYVLRTFEETAKWRLSPGDPDICLIRPLPWLSFLMLIIVLRLLLIYLSLGALLLGDSPVTANKFIYFIQTRRRKLRSIRMHGLKVIQERANEHKAQNVGEEQNSWMAKLSSIFNRVVCRPRSHTDDVNTIVMTRAAGVNHRAQSNTKLEVPATRDPTSKNSPRMDGSPLMSWTEKLNKFANENSDEDSDYVPANEDEEGVNDGSFSSVSSSNDTQANNLDTSDENAKDLSLTEKDQPKAPKSPKRTTVPTIEIKPTDGNKTFVTDLKNTHDDDGINMETISGDKVNSITMSPKTPLDNEGTNNGGLAAEVEVVQVHEVAKPQNALFVNLLNDNGDVQKKSTPGHETAAHSKPHLPPPLLGNVANANPTTAGMLVDAIADCFGNLNEIPTNIPTSNVKPTPTLTSIVPKSTPLPTAPIAPLSLCSSSTCSTTSSNSSLSSFMTSDDLVGVESRSDPPTPTPSINASSSTEDIYQSPFGSPPDFTRFSNAIENPFLSAMNKEETLALPNGDQSVDVEEVFSESKHFKPDPEAKSQNTKQQQQKYQQRYRNRNRR